MDQLDLAGKGIADEQIHQSAPYVRALVVERLELVWSACQPQIDRTEGKPDPRFVEAGLRCLKELAAVYRLHQPVPSATERADELVSKAEMVRAQLLALEARMSTAVD